jgi:2-dehydro-3-deoxyphosphogluconate aldolase / (4S)-4-hydroxy-2-oxoglutarate aldolase
MTRAEVCRRIEAIGVVPVVRLSSAHSALHAVDALVEGGIAVIEITLTVPDAFSVIRELSARFGDSVLVGAGTVLSPTDAERAVREGAQFIVSPALDAEVIRAAHELDVPAMPGVLTPTEIVAALRAGADWVKIFPCSAVGGARYLRALRGPFPDLKMLPTGGVNLATAAEYIAAGAAAVGIGSELLDPKELESGQYASSSARARSLVTSVRGARSKAMASDTTERSENDPGVATQTPSRGV